MKTVKTIAKLLLITLPLICLVMPITTQAQTSVSDSGSYATSPDIFTRIFNVNGTLKNTDTVKTKSFNRQDYDSTFMLCCKYSSLTDSINVTVKLQRALFGTTETAMKADSNWYTIDSLRIRDTVHTLIMEENVISGRAAAYRFLIIGSSNSGGKANGYTTTFRVRAILRRE